MRRLRENAMLEAEITATGDVTVEGQHVGHLHGFHFVPDPAGRQATEAKTLRNAASKALAGEIEARAERFSAAADTIARARRTTASIRWLGDPVAKLEPGDKLFEPRLRIVADEQLAGPARDKVEARLEAWLKAHVVRLLGPLLTLEESRRAHGPRPRHRLPDRRGARRSRALEGRCSEVRSLDQDGARRAAQAGRPLRRLSSLSAGAAEAGAARSSRRSSGRCSTAASTRRASTRSRIWPARAAPRSRSIRKSPRGSTAPPASASAAGGRCASTSWSGSPT